MYDQYIVGFMKIGGIGLGIRCEKDITIVGLVVSQELIIRLPKLVKFN